MTSLSYFHLGCALNNISTNVSTWNCTGMGQKASFAIQMVLKKVQKVQNYVGRKGNFISIFLAYFNIYNAIPCHSLEDNGLKANPESTKKKTKDNILWLTTNNHIQNSGLDGV